VSPTSTLKENHPKPGAAADPPIVCAFVRGERTWRFVFSSVDAANARNAAREIADRRELDPFDLALLDLLIRRALRDGNTRCTTVLTPGRRRNAPHRNRFISRTTRTED